MSAPSYRPSPQRLREFVETARRLKSERATAEEVVRQLLRATPVADWPQLADREELRNSGALERLGCESRDLLEKKPQEALAIAELATTIADGLAEDVYPAAVLAQVRAGAWKDRANALRYVTSFDAAYEAISRAEKTLMGHAALAVDRAVVDLVKALVLWELGHAAEAHALLQRAEIVFAEVGDTKRVHDARLIDASVLYNEGRYIEARATWLALLEQCNDAETRARLHHNLGYCDTHLGDFPSANIHFSEAIARFNDLGFKAEAARTQRGAGQLLIEKGQIRSGLAHLRDARTAFAAYGMVREAGLCGLRIAEALFDTGDVEGARLTTQEIARDFEQASYSAEMLQTLRDLEQSIADDCASSDVIRGVHSVIAAISDEHGSVHGAPVSRARLRREHGS